MREIKITKAQEGQRMDRFLGKCLPQASGAFLHKMLRKKNIKLNGLKAEGNEKLKDGDRIQIFFSDETFEKFRGNQNSKTDFRENSRDIPADRQVSDQDKARPDSLSSEARKLNMKEKNLRREVKVLYRDEDIVILHKPAGMLSQKAVKEDDSLNDYLIDLCRKEGWLDENTLEYFRPSVANRLDRNTSGIVLCGISTKGLQLLSRVLRDRSIAKYYLALVSGHVTRGKRLKGYLHKDSEKNVVTFSEKPEKDSAAIETEYEVLKAGKEASLLRIRLITGKSHQIRAHLAAEGYPMIGDYKYGDRRINQRLKQETGIAFQMLHSYEIDFGSQLGGLHIKDELPQKFRQAVTFFGLD